MSKAVTTSSELEDLLRRAEFPDVDYSAWKRRVEEELGGTTFADELVASTGEGVDVEPLYSADSAPIAGPEIYLGRNQGLETYVTEEYPIPDLDEAAATIAAGGHRGVGLAWLPVRYVGDSPSREGSPGPVRIAHLDELRVLVQGIAAEPVVEVVGELKPLEPAMDDCTGSFVCDPIGEAFRGGEAGELLYRLLADQADFTRREGNGPDGARTILVSTSAHHEAGAAAVDELALALATGVEYLRRLSAAGLGVDNAANVIFAFSVTDDIFVEIAKLRAARLLWSKILSAVGIEERDAWTWIHARGSLRALSEKDPRRNLLHGAVQCFAASVGGADSIAVTPYDLRPGPPSAEGRRLAVMTQQVLGQETHLDRIADPAAGSWCLEALTDRLARVAWKLFQELEQGGGMIRCLQDGRVQELVQRSAERRSVTVEERR